VGLYSGRPGRVPGEPKRFSRQTRFPQLLGYLVRILSERNAFHERLWQKFKEEDFVILAVDFEEGGDWVRSFVEENGYTFPILLDPTGEVTYTYRIPQPPTTYLIDPEGMIFAGIGQERDWATEDVFKLIEHLLPKTEANGSEGIPKESRR